MLQFQNFLRYIYGDILMANVIKTFFLLLKSIQLSKFLVVNNYVYIRFLFSLFFVFTFLKVLQKKVSL